MKKIICVLLVCLLLAGCAALKTAPNTTFLDVFDTMTTIVGDTDAAQQIHTQLQEYHKLFDIYNDYEGINNLKTINNQAGIAPVQVDGAIIDLLTDCVEYYHLTNGRVNVAMGSVLRLWHEARQASLEDPENAYVPGADALAEARAHSDIENLVIDKEKSTVFLKDPQMSLDVGAIAKGWAAQKVAETAPEGMLLSLGGNVIATGPKTDGAPWTVGIQDPKGEGVRETLSLRKGAVVTSGDYQRTYWVDGKAYPHIIDPETGMPAMLWSSVTVVHENSAVADALSTALFLMLLEDGKALAQSCGAKAIWIDKTGKLIE